MRLTPHQKKVMARLRARESLCFNYSTGTYQFRGDGGRVPNQTFRSLLKAKLIRELDSTNEWVAAEKGDGDGT